MKQKWIFIAAGGAFLLLALNGCGPTLPTCATGSLQAPVLASPAMWELVGSLSPTLSWTYPDATCNPEGYAIDLSTGPFFTDDLGGGTGNPSLAWSPGSPLQPGKEYKWGVQAINGTTLGPYGGSRYFFTGPMCDTAALSAPVLFEPADGAVITELEPSLIWEYMDGCLPQGYRVDLSVDPTFADTSLSGGTGNPSTRWGPGAPLADCTTYFWKIAPINDTTLGPASDVFSFRTNVGGACPAETPASVSGVIWHDQCSVPLDTSPAPVPMPEGCVEDAYGIDGDAIHQPSEPFLAGITVMIGPGDCPSGGPTSAVTDVNGLYTIPDLAPGKYCIVVDAESFAGPEGNGHWTLNMSGHEGKTYRAVMFGAGGNLTGQDFAWYQNLPVPSPTPVGPTPTPTPVPALNFIPNINANCRSGPDPVVYPAVDVAMSGQPYLLDGRIADSSWFRIMMSATRGCWVPASSGSPTGDISNLRVLIIPPTPTPTSVPTLPPTRVPVFCIRYTDQKTCESQPGCQWIALTTAGYCTNK